MSNERKERNRLKLILIMRFACTSLDVGHPICLQSPFVNDLIGGANTMAEVTVRPRQPARFETAQGSADSNRAGATNSKTHSNRRHLISPEPGSRACSFYAVWIGLLDSSEGRFASRQRIQPGQRK
jgi:hypothetical protein